MKKKKGFTLVELLAVIVILAVILVIAVPKIMDTIQNSKEGTLISSTKLIAAQAEKKYVENQTLGITDYISCDDVVKTTDDYDYCNISFDSNGKASVTISGKGKFEGMAVCGGTRTEGEISDNCYTDEECFKFNSSTGTISGYDYGKIMQCKGDVWVPDTIDGVAVKAIANYAFTTNGEEVSPAPVYNNYSDYKVMPLKNNLYNVEVMPIEQAYLGIGITSIKLPSTIESIGDYAFQDSEIGGTLDLSALTNLTSIGEMAFWNNDITSVILPSSVTNVKERAFEANPLTNITLGNQNATLGECSFGYSDETIVMLPDSYSCR